MALRDDLISIARMKGRIIKSLNIGVILYLTLLFGGILPAHTHDDCKAHSDCVLCVIADQPAIQGAVVAVLTISLPLPLIVAPFITTIPVRRETFYPTRAPPAPVV